MESRGIILRCSDLRQFVYCPRVIYFRYCLPVRPPPTYKMVEGKLQHEREEELEHRRTLRAYGLADGERHFGVHLSSDRLGLTGVVDMVIARRYEVIPVEFKNIEAQPEVKRCQSIRSRRAETQSGGGEAEEGPLPSVDLHHKYQLAAYALLAEERWEKPARRCFVYWIMARRAVEVEITPAARAYTTRLLRQMREMLGSGRIPEGTRRRGRCQDCEYRRFCNDVD